MQSNIKDVVSSSGGNNDKSFIRTLLRIMKDFGYTYREVLDLPIPVYIEIVEYIQDMETKRKQNGKK